MFGSSWRVRLLRRFGRRGGSAVAEVRPLRRFGRCGGLAYRLLEHLVYNQTIKKYYVKQLNTPRLRKITGDSECQAKTDFSRFHFSLAGLYQG
jgi:hypothetical protein